MAISQPRIMTDLANQNGNGQKKQQNRQKPGSNIDAAQNAVEGLDIDTSLDLDALPEMAKMEAMEFLKSDDPGAKQKAFDGLVAAEKLQQLRDGVPDATQTQAGATPGAGGQTSGQPQMDQAGQMGAQPQQAAQTPQPANVQPTAMGQARGNIAAQTGDAMAQQPELGTPDYAEWAKQTFDDPVMLEQQLRINREEQQRRQEAQERAMAHQRRMNEIRADPRVDAVREMSDRDAERPDATQFSPEARARAGTEQFDYSGFEVDRASHDEATIGKNIYGSDPVGEYDGPVGQVDPERAQQAAQEAFGDTTKEERIAGRKQTLAQEAGISEQRAMNMDLTELEQQAAEARLEEAYSQMSIEELQRQADRGGMAGRKARNILAQKKQQQQQRLAKQQMMQENPEAVIEQRGKTQRQALEQQHERQMQQSKPVTVEPGQTVIRNGEVVYRNESDQQERFVLGPNDKLTDREGNTVAENTQQDAGTRLSSLTRLYDSLSQQYAATTDQAQRQRLQDQMLMLETQMRDLIGGGGGQTSGQPRAGQQAAGISNGQTQDVPPLIPNRDAPIASAEMARSNPEQLQNGQIIRGNDGQYYVWHAGLQRGWPMPEVLRSNR